MHPQHPVHIGIGHTADYFSRRVDWIEESVSFCLRADVIARAFGSQLSSHTCLCFVSEFIYSFLFATALFI